MLAFDLRNQVVMVGRHLAAMVTWAIFADFVDTDILRLTWSEHTLTHWSWGKAFLPKLLNRWSFRTLVFGLLFTWRHPTNRSWLYHVRIAPAQSPTTSIMLKNLSCVQEAVWELVSQCYNSQCVLFLHSSYPESNWYLGLEVYFIILGICYEMDHGWWFA